MAEVARIDQALIDELYAAYRAVANLMRQCESIRRSKYFDGSAAYRQPYMALLNKVRPLLSAFQGLQDALQAAPILNNDQDNGVDIHGHISAGLSILGGVLEAFLEIYLQPEVKERMGFHPRASDPSAEMSQPEEA